MAKVKPAEKVSGTFWTVFHSNHPKEYQFIEIQVKDSVVEKVTAHQPNSKDIAVEAVRRALLVNEQESYHAF